MASTQVPYYDLLMGLIHYQMRLGMPVRFQFQQTSLGPGAKSVALVNPVLEDNFQNSTVPLFTHPNLEPIQSWADQGFILILDGRITRGQGEFLLTSKTITLASRPF